MGKSPVTGLGVFREHMAGLEGSYALIGGTACSILLSDADLEFRATRDFDTVLVADGRLPATARAVWSLVQDGGYRPWRGHDERAHFYRFDKPQQPGYPTMIELFSRKPLFEKEMAGSNVAPLHVGDEVSSLSAILLDDEYYQFMLAGIKTVDGISVLDEAHLIPFKARAYLDLSSRKLKGEKIDRKNIKKHRLDVFRLSQLLTGGENIELPESIRSDMSEFIKDCAGSPVDMRQIGIKGISFDEAIAVLRDSYGLA